MENTADLPIYPIYSALATIEDLFGVRIKETTFEEWAVYAISKVGTNKRTTKVSAKVGKEGYVNIPCRVAYVEAVTTDEAEFRRWDVTNIDDPNIKATSRFGDHYEDLSTKRDYLSGDFVDFQIVDYDTLKVSESLVNRHVFILLKEVVTNNEDVPMFNDKQIEAIAYFIMFLYAQRQYAMGKRDIDLAYFKRESSIKIAQAKIPHYVSQNKWDEFLDVKTSHGRKMFNRNFKLV